jgi:CRP/FNR family cyclic AMP-dependent transcriptional regulator
MLEAVLPCDSGMALSLLDQGRVLYVDERTYVAHQGETVGTLWLVLEGRIKLESCSSSGRSSRLGVHGPGDWIGSYARAGLCPADIAALDRVTLLAFASGDLPELALRQPQIGVALALSFARQLENMLAKLDARSTLTAKGRIYAELLRRAAGRLEIAPCPVVAELALAAQTTRETASRAIAELERRGIITRDARRLRIESPRLLNDLVV